MTDAGWYLKKATGTIYGPTDIATLQEWARNGRIAPDDQVSGDRETWEPAPDIPPLEMQWFVDLPDGGSYGPVHLGAFLDMLKEGALDAESLVRRKDGGEPQPLGTLAAPPPAPEPAAAPPPAVEAEPPTPAAPAPAAAPAAAAPAEPAGSEPISDAVPERSVSWQTLARERDHFEHEMLKWKALYEVENESARRHEAQVQDLQRELERERIDGSAARLHLEKEIEGLRKQHADLDQFASSGDVSLVQGYRELSRTCDLLAEQLDGKAAALKESEEALRLLRKSGEERLRLVEEQLAQERAESDRIRARLEELEGAHREIVQSYREMNDRYIRMREQVSGLPPPSKDSAGGSPAPGSPSGVRLRR